MEYFNGAKVNYKVICRKMLARVYFTKHKATDLEAHANTILNELHSLHSKHAQSLDSHYSNLLREPF